MRHRDALNFRSVIGMGQREGRDRFGIVLVDHRFEEDGESLADAQRMFHFGKQLRCVGHHAEFKTVNPTEVRATEPSHALVSI